VVLTFVSVDKIVKCTCDQLLESYRAVLYHCTTLFFKIMLRLRILFLSWESKINYICFLCPGYYKYCLDSTYCPNCIRQVYLNLFTRSVCLASLGKSQLDCKEHNFTQKFTAPNTAGSYYIKVMILCECLFAF